MTAAITAQTNNAIQTIIVSIIVLAAIGWIINRLFIRKNKSACDSCGLKSNCSLPGQKKSALSDECKSIRSIEGDQKK